MAPVLYNYDLDDNCYKVRLALSAMAIAHETVAVNAWPGKEQETPLFRAINPAGTLPILQDGGLTLFGAEAILAHLALTHDASGRWFPASGAGFATVMQWLGFAAGELSAASRARALALFGGKGDEAEIRVRASLALRAMEDVLTLAGFEGRRWFAGEEPTIADLALFPGFALSRDYGVDHDEYPSLRRWARQVRALPGFVSMPGIPDYH